MALAGRADESATVLGCVADAVAGRASTLLVRGAAGVGKTSLIDEVCRAGGGRSETLWASCLPLTSMTTPLLPLRPILRRAGLADDVTLVEFDSWVDRITAERPVTLVIDDLQWADQSSLDALLYLIAGPAERGIAVLATLRSGVEGERLSRWLADVQRLPRVRELILRPLDRFGTGEQIFGIFGRPADEGLVDEVYARTAGNPYLTRLLVRDVDPGATVLPTARPAHLREAVIRPWSTMSPSARELSRIVAVGGHPQAYEELARIAPALGFAGPALPTLREAVDAEVLRALPDGRYWFTHPLLAEILDGDLLPEQRRQLHASYASMLDGDVPASPADLAGHYDRAGMAEPAFRWAVRAAEATTGAAEKLRLLRRALALWADVEHPGTSRVDLWERIRDAAEAAGLGPDELAATEALIELLPSGQERKLGLMMSRRAVLRSGTGIDGPNVELRQAAVAVTAAYPSSVEHALTTARLAEAMLFDFHPDGVSVAAAALELAEACGSEVAIAEALVPAGYAKFRSGRPDAAVRDVARAWEINARLRRFAALKATAYATANLHPSATVREVAGVYRRAAEEFAARGAPHSHIAEMCAWEANQLLWLGDWRNSRRRLRVALGARPGARGDALARLTAAELACLQGRQAEAEAHLARAEEVFPAHSQSWLAFEPVRVKLALAAGRSAEAFETAVRDLEQTQYVEDMLPLGARALADQAEADRDAGRNPASVLAELADFRRRYPVVDVEPGQVVPEVEQRAMQTRADAETARARRDPAELAFWQDAADACRAAELRWDEAYVCWRQAQAALRDRRAHRKAPEVLRRAHRLTIDLAAERLLADVERLACSARIDLTATDRPAPAPELPGLTSREREVLGYLLAGRTNSEIAKALVLSEKTVGVHISNMLRKTGTANRVQLAELGRRHGEEAAV